MKAKISILALGLVVLGVSGARAATTLLDDTFTESSRSLAANQPTSIPWYVSGSSSGLAISSNQLVWNTAGSTYIAMGYFNSQTLGVGDSLTLSFTFSATSIVSGTNGFRLGLLASGGSKVTADNYGISNSVFNNYQGYGVFDDLGYLSGTEAQLWQRPSTSANPNPLGGGAPLTMGSTGSGANLTSGTSYTGTMTVTNNGANTTVTYNLGSTSLSYTTTANYSSFDTIMFQSSNSQAATISFSDIKVAYTAVPEPGTTALLILGLGTVCWVASRRFLGANA